MRSSWKLASILTTLLLFTVMSGLAVAGSGQAKTETTLPDSVGSTLGSAQVVDEQYEGPPWTRGGNEGWVPGESVGPPPWADGSDDGTEGPPWTRGGNQGWVPGESVGPPPWADGSDDGTEGPPAGLKPGRPEGVPAGPPAELPAGRPDVVPGGPPQGGPGR